METINIQFLKEYSFETIFNEVKWRTILTRLYENLNEEKIRKGLVKRVRNSCLLGRTIHFEQEKVFLDE